MLSVGIAIQVTYAVAAIFGVALGVALWPNRDSRAVFALAITAFGASIWSASMLVQTFVGEFWYVQFHRVMYLGTLTTLTGVFVFALEYTGRERYVTRRTIGVLVSLATIAMFLVIFNPGQLFLGELQEVDTPIGYMYGWAPLYPLYLVYVYGLVTAFIVMVLEFILRSKRALYRGQAVALLLAALIPGGANVFFMGGAVDFDITPLGLVVTASLLTFAVVRYQLGDVTPIAREKVIDNVRDGMLVVNTEGRVTDSNPAANRMLGLDDSPIGDAITTILDPIPELQEAYTELTAAREEGERTVGYGDRYLKVKATPIEDDHDRHVGWTFLLEDVTERVRRERDLEQQIERLDMFASIVSHDLRNPINVAKGYIDQTEVTGDLEHLEKSKDALDRMEDIIEDVLTLTREGGDVTEPTAVDVERLAREAWENVDTGEATLEVVAPDGSDASEADEPVILADESRLLQLFENLFRNSIEHGVPETDEAGDAGGEPTAGHRVTVGTTAHTGSEATLYVADNGTGIPPDKRDKVFEDGYTTGGTGLGLTIVAQIAEAHGWEETVTDSGDGGARFEFHGVGTPIRTVVGSDD